MIEAEEAIVEESLDDLDDTELNDVLIVLLSVFAIFPPLYR